jgi:hypothetical protein
MERGRIRSSLFRQPTCQERVHQGIWYVRPGVREALGDRRVRSCDEQSLPLGDFCDLVEGQVEISGDVCDGLAGFELALDDG